MNWSRQRDCFIQNTHLLNEMGLGKLAACPSSGLWRRWKIGNGVLFMRGIVSACHIYRGQLDNTSHTLPVETATIESEDQNLEAVMQSIWGCFRGFKNLILAVLEEFWDKWGQHVFIPSYFILSAWKCPVKARHSYSVFLETLWS